MPNDAPKTVDAKTGEIIEREVATLDADSNTVALLNKSEIDQQISTARKFPRSVRAFRQDVEALACMNEDVAAECSYAVPRDGKTIIGPSARFAEIVAHSWGNSRCGARVVDDRGDMIVAQGAFMDLEKNVAITYEVQRRITTSKGKRYSPDMITTTANAACSIALRNSILKGVPKALWVDLWEKARKVAVGDVTTFANRRAKIIERLAPYGVTPAKILAKLGRAGVEDITPNDLELLLAIGSAIKNEETTAEEAFAVETTEATTGNGDPAKGAAGLKEKLKGGETKAANAETKAGEGGTMVDKPTGSPPPGA